MKAAEKNKAQGGQDFYRRIGAIGGKAKVSKGFGKRRDLARTAGAKGGRAKWSVRGSSDDA